MELNEFDKNKIKAVELGKLFEGILTNPGWSYVYFPRLEARLKEIDSKCHSFTGVEKDILFYNGVYNGLKYAMDLAGLICKEKEQAEKYCQEHNINV